MIYLTLNLGSEDGEGPMGQGLSEVSPQGTGAEGMRKVFREASAGSVEIPRKDCSTVGGEEPQGGVQLLRTDLRASSEWGKGLGKHGAPAGLSKGA